MRLDLPKSMRRPGCPKTGCPFGCLGNPPPTPKPGCPANGLLAFLTTLAIAGSIRSDLPRSSGGFAGLAVGTLASPLSALGAAPVSSPIRASPASPARARHRLEAVMRWLRVRFLTGDAPAFSTNRFYRGAFPEGVTLQ